MSVLPFDKFGNEAGCRLLFLHGFLGARQDWLRVAQALSDRVCCVTVDLPGHGEANHLKADFKETIEAVIALLNALDVRKIGLVGYSMGGRIALYAALHFPHRFHFVILVSASPGIEESERADRRRREELWAERFRHQPLAEALDQWYAQPLFADIRSSPYYAETIARRLKNRPEAVAAALLSLGQASQPPMRHKLPELVVPLHLIVGEKDEKYRREAEWMRSVLPSATLHVVKECGHAVHLENPTALADVIAEILQQSSLLDKRWE
ncbi:MAG: 2-succinyl-6-hydroxy-2,4-cyclohexadiene-1-carboxylate synthase [candidate division KSB1 bacterium]|nr:2-succinyl-6-hydroxy-2,4-cyclohexadiene-1-carboxylate synthase [candidate division KSB1 bacterium]MDZ7346452.1 2-succinyl-6-hydroxy-2,4-cyclohexadiene-1-carboxylate synthase [candidate division KSB1 bacterium]